MIVRCTLLALDRTGPLVAVVRVAPSGQQHPHWLCCDPSLTEPALVSASSQTTGPLVAAVRFAEWPPRTDPVPESAARPCSPRLCTNGGFLHDGHMRHRRCLTGCAPSSADSTAAGATHGPIVGVGPMASAAVEPEASPIAQATLATALGGIIAVSLAQQVRATAPTVLSSRSSGDRGSRYSPLHPKEKPHSGGNLA